jgi:hypothetical protein
MTIDPVEIPDPRFPSPSDREYETNTSLNHLKMAISAVVFAASNLQAIDQDLAGEAREISVRLKQLTSRILDTQF